MTFRIAAKTFGELTLYDNRNARSKFFSNTAFVAACASASSQTCKSKRCALSFPLYIHRKAYRSELERPRYPVEPLRTPLWPRIRPEFYTLLYGRAGRNDFP